MSKRERIVRAIIENEGYILLCKHLKKSHFFLPGGHIEEGESPEQALARELFEEIGRSVEIKTFITEVTNSFWEGGEEREEVFYVYKVLLDSYDKIKSKEDHIAYEWIPIEGLEEIDFKPQKALSEIRKYVL